jgi:hypothetical protein
LLISVALVSIAAFALQRSSPAAEKVRVLLTVGGHGYEEQPFYAFFKSLPGVAYTLAHMPEEACRLGPGLEKQYDAIVMYDMVGGIPPARQAAFVALLEKGIGVVSLHHNMAAHPSWPEFGKIIGGKFFLKDQEFAGKAYKQSTWDHDQEIDVTVVDREHPITKGLSDFRIHDEVYKGYWTAPGAHVLLKTDHPKNNPELAWVTTYANSRIFYLMLGHDSKAWANPNYKQLVARGIHWAAGR